MQICPSSKSILLLALAGIANSCIPALAQNADLKPEERQLESSSVQASSRQIAQSSGNVVATPIPPIVTGTVDLEEVKISNVIDLEVSSSRTFKLRNKIVRTSIADPGVAEPVVVAENQLVLLGKSPGVTSIIIWDDAGNVSYLDLRVSKNYGPVRSASQGLNQGTTVKPVSINGSDRLIQMGTVDNAESVIRSSATGNTVTNDRGLKIEGANNRLPTQPVGERSGR